MAYQLHIEEMERSIEELVQNSSRVAKELTDHDEEFGQLTFSFKPNEKSPRRPKRGDVDAESHLASARAELFRKRESLSSLQGKLHGVRERLQFWSSWKINLRPQVEVDNNCSA